MTTLRLSAKNRRERLKANPAPKVGSRAIPKPTHTTDDLKVFEGEHNTYALRKVFYADEKKHIQSPNDRRCVEREMGIFQKILTAEGDLAEFRGLLKVATDDVNTRLMNYCVKEVKRLERKLCRLRGVKDPHRKRKTGRVFTKTNGGLWVDMPHREEFNRHLRSWDRIAHDKLRAIEDEQNREKWETAEEIATLQGFKKGTIPHLQATADAWESIVMIERLQAFEDTQSKYAHHAEDQLRYEHFCDNR